MSDAAEKSPNYLVLTDAPIPEKDDLDEGCNCGLPLTWDPERSGYTCGGVYLHGALVCPCGKMYIGDESRGAELAEWKINKGGRSVDTGLARIRIDGDGAAELMKRIVRLPELEALERGTRK